MAQTFTLNVSLPSSPTSLLTRLQLATNQVKRKKSEVKQIVDELHK